MTQAIRLFLLACLTLCAALPAAAQQDRPGAAAGLFDPGQAQALPEGPLRVGVQPMPPFASRTKDGAHLGLAVDLWRLIAESEGLTFDLVALEPGGAEAALREGRVDLALPVIATEAREEAFDLTQPIYTATMGVAGHSDSRLWTVVTGFASLAFLRIILGLSLLLLIVGALIWLLERRRNGEQFHHGAAKGLGDGFWWAGVTLTTIGYGDKAPVTTAGRAVAMLWMLVGLAVSSILTATVVNLTGIDADLQLPEALADQTVGVVEGSSTQVYLQGAAAELAPFPDLPAALAALEADSVDSVAAATPALRSAIADRGAYDWTVTTSTLDPALVAFALPQGSPLREGLDRALLRLLSSESGWTLTERYMPEG
ncbi:transporter substrate-binding domain-containing protein [Pseudoroseicyclus aestuarii]|uniref:Amino acid ABC transporter substrate-binding protein (PAAT family) n=1 Tax=Pseudoroseicyclus aestuarii TaxID=1795041 RepID=A0A318T1K0_9RHOB|nr:transporter substrate-binding domain-containing protein [Pseudoroseicyclus aestuarii]PYE84064.1 amino acid ABC transporter substrate-binding protein (PAAT family) [Pseudoroseicyclus aestuarii]